MGRMKNLAIKLQEGGELTKEEKEYLEWEENMRKRDYDEKPRVEESDEEDENDGTEEDYMYQEALKDIEELNKIDPPDEE
jgi:hypothetical protein